ncbi:SpaH/EbpB family LPXTG-anchored major pilin [Corynebacterium lehmanniae]|uniref:SpaH/EbpB family LPXTG-anchored major pilin n=1 Tax=Corynebacterium lehmanniae TaxID=2913497 RepID=A0ABT4R667_9CORY|nr:SpaH/EbpB family LPXTG-anchored major pilin [Corynebacterium lehmanniae]MCZ9291049.1 SpaH/EbpB family LPXTG-anchored major pilin [Corynebacterium lehmanniae]
MAIAIKKTAAIAIAAGLTFAGSTGIAAQDALAQETSAAAPAAATIPDTVNFTIHKKQNPQSYGPATGSENDAASGSALNGVTFEVQRITAIGGKNKDIHTQADFNELAKLGVTGTAEDYSFTGATGEVALGAATTMVTAGEGVATANLPAGAYLVRETKTPDVEGSQKYQKSAPFIVFLPMTNDEGTGWNSNVHVFPKNTYLELDKSVEDADDNTAGNDKEADDVTYTLKSRVPSAQEGQALNDFGFIDTYDKTEIKFDLNKVTVDATLRNGQAVTADDYKIIELTEEQAKSYNKAEKVNAGYYIKFNEPWMLKADSEVTVTFTGANLLDGADDRINNTVRLVANEITPKEGWDPNNPPEDTPPGDTPPGDTPPTDEPPVPPVTVNTYKGDIVINKFKDENSNGAKDGNEGALKGAKFALYKNCDTTDKAALTADTNSANLIRTGETNKDGKLVFNGLHVTDLQNDTEAIDKKYCVVETEAPAGYILNPNVFEFTLKKEGVEAGEDGNLVIEAAKDVPNKPDTTTPPLLPSTGGMGVLIIALAGLAIIGGGVYAARRNSQSA